MSPTFGIAFGGGGARGLAHIHVVEVFDELGIKPVVIAGSSIGAIIGAAMAAGLTGYEIRDYAHSILSRRSEVAMRIWRAKPDSLTELMQGGLHVSQFNVERILKAFLPKSLPDSFAELRIPLKVAATDYYGHELAVLEQGDLLSALAASSAIPAMFRPVLREGRVLIDGGIYNPVPFDLIGDIADIVVAIDVVGGPVKNGARRPSSIDLMFGATQLMMQAIIDGKLSRSRPHIMIQPPVSKFRVLDFLKFDAVMKETASIRDDLKRQIEQAVKSRTLRKMG